MQRKSLQIINRNVTNRIEHFLLQIIVNFTQSITTHAISLGGISQFSLEINISDWLVVQNRVGTARSILFSLAKENHNIEYCVDIFAHDFINVNVISDGEIYKSHEKGKLQSCIKYIPL